MGDSTEVGGGPAEAEGPDRGRAFFERAAQVGLLAPLLLALAGVGFGQIRFTVGGLFVPLSLCPLVGAGILASVVALSGTLRFGRERILVRALLGAAFNLILVGGVVRTLTVEARIRRNEADAIKALRTLVTSPEKAKTEKTKGEPGAGH